MNVTVPRENAKVGGIEIGFARRLPGDSAFSFGYYTGESFDGLYTGQLGPAIDPEDFVGLVGTEFAKGSKNSPYAYVLKWFSHGRNFSGFEKDVRDDELAKVDFTYAKTQKQMGFYPFFRPSGPFFTGGGSSIGYYDKAMRVRTYVQPEGVRWSGAVEQVGSSCETCGVLLGGPKKYRAGKTYREGGTRR